MAETNPTTQPAAETAAQTAAIPTTQPGEINAALANPRADMEALDALERTLFSLRYAMGEIGGLGPVIDPPKATAQRGEAMAQLQEMSVRAICDPAVAPLLDRLEAEPELIGDLAASDEFLDFDADSSKPPEGGETPEEPPAEPEVAAATGLSASGCIDPALLERITGRRILVGKDPGQRPACGCALSVDIGSYHCCRHRCRYCYANRSTELKFLHDPDSPLLLGRPEPGMRISERRMEPAFGEPLPDGAGRV